MMVVVSDREDREAIFSGDDEDECEGAECADAGVVHDLKGAVAVVGTADAVEGVGESVFVECAGEECGCGGCDDDGDGCGKC